MTVAREMTLDATELQRIQAVPGAIVSAWAAHDGAAFAEIFAPDGTMVLPHQAVCRGREAIAAFMSAAFQGPYRGTQVVGEPVHLQVLSPDSAVLVSRGGVRAVEEAEVPADRRVNATWVLVKLGGEWKLAAYHNSPAT